MNSFSLRVTVGIIVILVGFGAVVRIILQRRVKKLLEKINHTLPYAVAAGRLVSDRSGNNNLPGERELWFRGIPADLNDSFQGTIVTAAQKQNFVNHYAEFLREVSILARIPRFLRMMPYDFLKFLQDFEAIDELVKQHNSSVINLLMERYRDFFDHCLQYPLDIQQRRAILSEEDNCLVVSSAGSGKTSSIAGKVKYLTEIKGVEPSKILLISYTNKAAHELTERIAIHGLIGYTFHKLAIDLIGRATGAKPLVFDGTDTIFTEVYRRLSAKSFFFGKSG